MTLRSTGQTPPSNIHPHAAQTPLSPRRWAKTEPGQWTRSNAPQHVPWAWPAPVPPSFVACMDFQRRAMWPGWRKPHAINNHVHLTGTCSSPTTGVMFASSCHGYLWTDFQTRHAIVYVLCIVSAALIVWLWLRMYLVAAAATTHARNESYP